MLEVKMKSPRLLPYLILLGIVMVVYGCGNTDDNRIAELHGLPGLWESEVIVSDPAMPELRVLVPTYDSIDPTLYEALKTDKFSEDYIPEAVQAFTNPNYRGKTRIITLRIGDVVEVLDCKTNNTGRDICLVRTFSDTYAWIYSFHLNDQNGFRMASFG